MRTESDIAAIVKSLRRHINKSHHSRRYLLELGKEIYRMDCLTDGQKDYLGEQIVNKTKPRYRFL